MLVDGLRSGLISICSNQVLRGAVRANAAFFSTAAICGHGVRAEVIRRIWRWRDALVRVARRGVFREMHVAHGCEVNAQC